MTSIDGAKLTRNELQSYWTRLSREHLTRQDDGLSAICYAGMPAWFNRFLDVYQRKAMARLVASEDFTDKRILDIGTGVGRWARWFEAQAPCAVVGIDIESVRLQTAREYGGNIQYLEMPANSLAFPDASFDVVNTITVLQHVDHDVKREAIAEFGRVVRRGGKVIVFEITDEGDDASHVYPWPKDAWVNEFKKNGFTLARSVGDQYIPVLRAMKGAYKLYRGRTARSDIETMKSGGGQSAQLLLPLRLATALSYPLEEVARFFPTRFARITGFLFEKA
jgi:ubiquinone/menaquinone biosynthesis C-methylase UbiE